MPYNRYLAERIERILSDRKVPFYQNAMMGELVLIWITKCATALQEIKKPKGLEFLGILDKS
jgi:hypothetical protein